MRRLGFFLGTTAEEYRDIYRDVFFRNMALPPWWANDAVFDANKASIDL